MCKCGIIDFFFILKREKETLNINIIVYTNTDTSLLLSFNPFREQVNETNSTKLKTRDKAYFLLLTRGGQRSRT